MAWMIYGANGYTGRLCAEAAAARGLDPILAGRRVSAVAPLATALDLDHRVFSLDDVQDAARALEGIDVVLHCAGPFSATSQPMLEACMRAGAHYLDITGEIAVFENLFARHPEIRRAGIAAVSGVGFDVVPTDAMAAKLGEALPTADRLELAFAGLGGGVSRGTARTALEGLPKGGAARIEGRIKRVPTAWRTREVRLGDRRRTVVSIPWGDVSTAYHTTGIPNITTYAAFPKSMIRTMKATAGLQGVLGAAPIQAALRGLVDARVDGPGEDERARGVSFVWGRAEDADGHWVEGHLRTPEGYRFTVVSGLAAVQRVLDDPPAPGAHTPSRAFGSEFVDGLEGVEVDALTRG